MWEYRKDVARELRKTRLNPEMLPGIEIPKPIHVTDDLEKAVTDKEAILIALPSHVVRPVCEQLAQFSLNNVLLVSCSKGIENYTLLRMSQLIKETIPNFSEEQIVVLSGPSHAEEVSRSIPTVVVAASSNYLSSRRIQELFMCPTFRVYTTHDVIGVELGGALKNVIAIAAGISDGVGCGDNTKAALMTRGMVEITRLGTKMGAESMTFAGLSGIGDLFVTCMSRHSRNWYVGHQIGKGRRLKTVLNRLVKVAEGVRTTQSAVDLAAKHHVMMPITQQVYHVLFDKKDPKIAVHDLMSRDAKAEDWG
jgi:glycerol-3-phosphate dehydrogenase (NAD(P)+)